jgi:hypothetical protein
MTLWESWNSRRISMKKKKTCYGALTAMSICIRKKALSARDAGKGLSAKNTVPPAGRNAQAACSKYGKKN